MTDRYESRASVGLDVEAVLRQFLTEDGYIAECDIPHIVAALTAPPADQADPKRRPYNASGSLSEYGVFPECDAQQQQGPDYTFTEAMKVCEEGLREWREKPHNKRWWKRIDGTPIPNDLLCCIAEALAAHRKQQPAPDVSALEEE